MVVAKCCFLGFVVGDRTYNICSGFTVSQTLMTGFFDCLLASLAAMWAEDVHASFLSVGDLNGHQQEWLGSKTINRHDVAAFDFATVSGCDQLAVGPTHARGGTLGLLMRDVPDLVRVSVVAPIGNSDHSSLSAVISMAQAVPNLCVKREGFLKYSSRHPLFYLGIKGGRPSVTEAQCTVLGF